MKKILILIASFSLALTQTTNCIGMNQATCTSAGYCFWNGSTCQLGECHKVTDVRACRSTGTAGYLQSQSRCSEITTIDPNFLNQCMEFSQTTLMYAYVRFPQDITQLYSSKTISGYLVTTIMNAKYTSQYKYEILTVNILTASTTELYDIMTAYVQMQYDLADPEIHPQYIEKAIYESMQAIRDDVKLTFTSTPKKQDYYTVLWRMTDAYFLKLRSYQPFYISNKYLINFGFAHFNRFSITLSSQYQSTKVTWTSYNDNGYLELLVIPAEQFGILSSSSDIIIIRPSKLDGSDGTLSYTLQWTWSYTGNPQPATSDVLYTFDKIEMNTFTSGVSAGCNTSTKTCTISISNQSTTKAYIIGSSSFSQSNSNRYYTRCRLGRYTWNGATNSCA